MRPIEIIAKAIKDFHAERYTVCNVDETECARRALLALAEAELSEAMINAGWGGDFTAVRFDESFRAMLREIANGASHDPAHIPASGQSPL